jgi:peptidoglycan DL-endopeptidase CwlO
LASPDSPVRRHRAPDTRWLAALALVVPLVAMIGGGPAHGGPIEDKRAEARALQDAIEANGTQIGALSEQYNGAQYRLEEAQAAIAAAQLQLEATRAEVERLKVQLNERAGALYRGVGQQGLVGFDVSNATEVISRSKYSDLAAEHDQMLVDELHRAEGVLRDQQAQAEQAQADARDEQGEIKKARARVEAANARQEQLLSQVNGEIAQLVAEEQARREAAELAAAQQRFAAAAAANTAAANTAAANTAAAKSPSTAPSTGTGAGGGNAGGGAPGGGGVPAPVSGPPPAVSGGAATAIEYARAQIGKPYCYAGAGPSCFDCSGLTMRAWGAAGVSMVHYSGAQYTKFPKVPLNAMQPGDLVFWGPNGSQHVGLYIGGGQMIAAPHTGAFVRIQAVSPNPVGAVRPG